MCPHAARPEWIPSPPAQRVIRSTATPNNGGARIGRPFPSLGDEFHDEFPLARPVEFTKEDALPAPQCHPSVFHEHDLAAAHEHGLYLRIQVAFSVLVLC